MRVCSFGARAAGNLPALPLWIGDSVTWQSPIATLAFRPVLSVLALRSSATSFVSFSLPSAIVFNGLAGLTACGFFLWPLPLSGSGPFQYCLNHFDNVTFDRDDNQKNSTVALTPNVQSFLSRVFGQILSSHVRWINPYETTCFPLVLPTSRSFSKGSFQT